ncbi:MAG TPA: hypothetical protein VJU86_04420 [Pyrinomonadaceae bacterium]|nr:hypothetical protein [Pyrinomonadaceae bacterium]
MKQRIPVLFCIDVEPEDRKVHRHAPSDWLGVEECVEFFQNLRPRLAKATNSPVHFSWFLRMDPQIAQMHGSPDWAAIRYRSLLSQLETAGDEIGLHSHSWRWDEESHDWFADFGDPEWVDHCIASAFDAFRSSMNRRCKSFRFGDHWMSERGLDLLEKLGTEFDLTLEPGQAAGTLLPDERFTGSFPDCRDMPQVPYQPSKDNFVETGSNQKRKIWLIPVSADLPESGSPQSNGHADQPYVTLNLAFSSSTFSSITDRLLRRLDRPFLVIVARSDIAIRSDQRVNLVENIEYLLAHPLVETFQCVTPAEGIKHLRFSPLRWFKETLTKSNA